MVQLSIPFIGFILCECLNFEVSILYFQFPLLGSNPKVESVTVVELNNFQFPLLGSLDAREVKVGEKISFQFPLLGSWETGYLIGHISVFLSIPFIGFRFSVAWQDCRRSWNFQFPLLGSEFKWTGGAYLGAFFQFPLLGSTSGPKPCFRSVDDFQFPLLGS